MYERWLGSAGSSAELVTAVDPDGSGPRGARVVGRVRPD